MSKTEELKNFSYHGVSNKGNLRRSNEDRYAYFETVNGTFFIVCDGMGGIKGGKEAAEITIAEIERYVNEDWYEDPYELIRKIFEHANRKVFDFFFSKIQKPGTTLAVVLIRHNEVYYGHAGDSRIYYRTGKRLFQLTKDHSYVMNLVDRKIITEEEAKTHTRRNEITKAVGIHNEIEPTICKEPIRPADYDNILLCTDGLTNELSNQEISKIVLEETDTEKKAKKLLNEALDSGGLDNISIQLIRFYNTGRDINKRFIKQNVDTTNRYKITTILGLSAIIISLALILIINKPFEKNNKFEENIASKTNLLISKAQEKETLLKVFFYENTDLHKELLNYNLLVSEINYQHNPENKNIWLKYYIPVRRVYYYQVGKLLYSYPEIGKDNIIDIIIVNNKSELFFKPGEKLIIPIKKNN